MNTATQRTIEVWADWSTLGTPTRLGTLTAAPSRSKEVFSFEYDPAWLTAGNAQNLDPSLLLFTGPQYPKYQKSNFGMFLDSSPDRWGRFLMDRREAQTARVEGRERRQMRDSGYLLGVYDGNRMGALRFRTGAMTLLNRTDGDDASTGVSYLELAEFLTRNGAHPDRDLEQLWRRIVFYICISNADDHLRNHGFLLDPAGWILSPAYDMNPDPFADGLKLNITDVENTQDLDLALAVTEYFRVAPPRAVAIINEVVSVVKQLRRVANNLNVPREEMEQMAHAFRVAESA